MNKERKTTEKICKFCSKDFTAKSKSAKFCSSNCRQDNYLKNKEDKNIKDIDKLYKNFDLTEKYMNEFKDKHNLLVEELEYVSKSLNKIEKAVNNKNKKI
jgi:hypothetical protein